MVMLVDNDGVETTLEQEGHQRKEKKEGGYHTRNIDCSAHMALTQEELSCQQEKL